jgi:cytochrome c oxidase subunit III
MADNHTHTEHLDSETGKLGMWIFLFTELFLFGGLFLVYAIFRAKYSADFHTAAAELNAFIGTINTVFLLVSSMTVAMALTAIQKGRQASDNLPFACHNSSCGPVYGKQVLRVVTQV